MAIPRRYANETFEIIRNRMLNSMRDDIDKRQGSIAFDLGASPTAAEIAQAYIALDNVLTFGFAGEDMPGEYLDLRCAELGVYRKPSVKATGQLTFTGDDGTEIPVGTRARTDDGVYFVTTEAGTIGNGVLTVESESEVAGQIGNVSAGTVVVSLGNITGVVSVNNELSFDGGVDTESDESLLSRYFERVQKPATSGNVFQYVQWAKEVPGVGEARVFPLWDGAGTVKVVIVDENKRPASPSLIDDTYEYIESVRPIGAEVTVESSPGKAISVTASIQLADGADLQAVQDAYSQSTNEYLESIAFVENYVSYAKIGSLLLSTEGVIDYADLTVNGGMINIALELDEAPYLDEVTLDVIT